MTKKDVELQNNEFKESWHDDYLQTISAFSNTDGGTLWIGKEDDGKIKGVTNSKNLLESIPNKIVNYLGILCDVHLREKESKEIIEIKVKPSSVAISYHGKFYKRIGTTTRELTGHELTTFLLQKSGKTWDEQELDGITLNDLDNKTIRRFQEDCKGRNDNISKERNIDALLEKIFLKDKKKFKRACVLLFGKVPQKYFVTAKIRIARFKTPTKFEDSQEVRGNLFQQLSSILDLLKAKYIKIETRITGMQNEEVWEYPEVAVREALLNAIVHKDYGATMPINIKVYENKIVFMNAGELPLGLNTSDLSIEHKSKPRNVLIAENFKDAKYIEVYGTGTLRIIEECKNAGLPSPEFVSGDGDFEVILYKDKYPLDELQQSGLNARQIKAIGYLKQNKRITNSEYQSNFKVKKGQASIDLTELVENDFLIKEGTTGKGTFYTLKGY